MHLFCDGWNYTYCICHTMREKMTFSKTILTVTMAEKELKIGKFGTLQGIEPGSLKI